MKRAVIIDDEPDARITLTNFLKKYCPDVVLSGEAGSVKEGTALLQKSEPDLVFLDVEMNDGTGFDLLDRIREKNFQVIFTTAFEEYALKAFKYSAVDYLLKPIDPDELSDAVKKIVNSESNHNINGEKLSALSYNIQNKANPRLGLPDLKGVTFVPVEDILYCKSDNNYTAFTLKSKQIITASKPLKDFEETLSSLPFCRIHNLHMINLNHVTRYVKGEGGYVVMSDNSELEVSRRKKAEFLERLARL